MASSGGREADQHRVDHCRFAYRLGKENTIGANSRLLLSDNTIFWIGPREDAVRPTGPFDPQLPVLAFYGPQDKLQGVIFNHSTHTIGTIKPNVRSPSFYGLAAQDLEQKLGATVCFLEGASGSTHNIAGVPAADAMYRSTGREQARWPKPRRTRCRESRRCAGGLPSASARSTMRSKIAKVVSYAASGRPIMPTRSRTFFASSDWN